ncbi:MAG: O-antigen ligase family protein, partial [Candidatus Aminicenantes bacterium]|nr:O-antigen ligase family protein [Candidatus Aminicenantes bacterium]
MRLPRYARNDKKGSPRFTRDDRLSNLLAYAIALFLLFSFWSISLGQIFLACALIFWILLLVTKKQKFEIPRFFWPLIVYSLLSLVSSLFYSVNPGVSLIDSKDLLLFLIVPITYMGLREGKKLTRANLALMASVWISIFYSLFSYFFAPPQSQRIAGFMGHYMTQAGLLLLFISLALGILFFSRGKLRYLWGTTLFFAILSLIVTMTRSAWIGAAVAVSVILFLYKPKMLLLVPVILGLVFLVSPKNVKQRVESIFSLKGSSNFQRIEYVKVGLKIMKAKPFFGTGPDTVDMEFQKDKYGLSEEAKQNVHL